MSLSLYHVSVASYLQTLGGVANVLAKGEEPLGTVYLILRESSKLSPDSSGFDASIGHFRTPCSVQREPIC
jgi:hypothetical protein